MMKPLTREEQERIRRRDSLPVIPETYGVMLRLLGEARTVRFIRRYGGGEARFPSHPTPDHDMVRILGRRAVEMMRAEYGALEVRWPPASNYLAMLDARALRLKGYDIATIARRVYRDTNTVKRYVAGIQPLREQPRHMPGRQEAPEPLPLFTWRRDRRG